MLKVLIVEDEDIIRKGLVYTFDWIKVDCTIVGEACDGQEGLKLIRVLSPDIVITDIRLPEIDGLKMIELASRTNAFCSIILTGYSEFEYAKQAVSLKVFEYLLKPVDEEKLAQTITRVHAYFEQMSLISRLKQKDSVSPLVDPEVFFASWTKPNYYVGQALRLIQSNYCGRLNIKGIASSLQVSCSYLSRKFKEETAHTFGEFLNKYRVQKAIEMLDQGNLRITEISDRVGFGEYKSFNSVFRRYVGMTCSEFAKSRVRIVYKKVDDPG
jgi:two-component system response regulator YesN